MDVFEALADPVRRDILDLLRSGECEAGAIAARFPISRPAISRHLRILRESGLVSSRLDGRRRLYRVQAERLGDVDAWLAPFREMSPPRTVVTDGDTWSSRLDALGTEVFRTRRERRQDKTASTNPAPNDLTSHEQEQSA